MLRWLCAVAVTTRVAYADPRAVGLREAIDFARAHQPSLAAARARVEVAREQARLPKAPPAPRVPAGAELLGGTNNNTTASFGGPLGIDVPRIGGSPANAPATWRPEPSTFLGIGVRQELYDFGRLAAQQDALDQFAHAAEEGATATDLDLVLLVEESFYAVQGSRAVLRASEAAVSRAKTHRDFAKANVDAQLRPPVVLTRAEADLARLEVERVRVAGQLTAAQQVLAAAIGSIEPALDAGTDDVPYPPMPPAIDL